MFVLPSDADVVDVGRVSRDVAVRLGLVLAPFDVPSMSQCHHLTPILRRKALWSLTLLSCFALCLQFGAVHSCQVTTMPWTLALCILMSHSRFALCCARIRARRKRATRHHKTMNVHLVAPQTGSLVSLHFKRVCNV